MINDELLNYITTQKMRGASREIIKGKLLASGWIESDAEEGLDKVFVVINSLPQQNTPSSIYNSNINTNKDDTDIKAIQNDKYLEPIETEIKPIEKPTAFQIPQRDEFMPSLMPKAQFIPTSRPIVKKVETQPSTPPFKNTIYQSFKPQSKPESTAQILNPENYSPNPKMAVTSSYKNDYQIAQATYSGGYNWVKWLTLSLVIIGLFGGLIFAYTKGFIKLPFNVSVIKPEPRQVLALVPNAQMKATSWKFEGDINLKFPSVYSMIGMMMSGDDAKSVDMDNISIKNKGDFSRGVNSMPVINLNLNTNTSLATNNIESEIHTKDGNIYMLLPDFSSIMPKFPLKSGWISMNASDADSIIDMLPESVNKFQLRMQKEFVLNSNKDSVWQSVMKILEDTLSKAQITDRGDEIINNTNTTHYDIVIDSLVVKESILSVIKTTPDLFSDQDIEQLSEVLNTLTIQSIELWIGKKDNLIYKYSFEASLPLSKLLSVNEKNFSESMATVNITELYYDYGSDVVANVPDQAVPVLQSLKDAQNEAIDSKTRIALQVDFANAARNLKKIEGSYGLKSNTKGDCVNPVSGSLFSPLGHKSKTINTIGLVSEQILLILDNTDNVGSCYSTTSAWAVAVPLKSKPDTLFCVDSTGKVADLKIPITGPVCK